MTFWTSHLTCSHAHMRTICKENSRAFFSHASMHRFIRRTHRDRVVAYPQRERSPRSKKLISEEKWSIEEEGWVETKGWREDTGIKCFHSSWKENVKALLRASLWYTSTRSTRNIKEDIKFTRFACLPYGI